MATAEATQTVKPPWEPTADEWWLRSPRPQAEGGRGAATRAQAPRPPAVTGAQREWRRRGEGGEPAPAGTAEQKQAAGPYSADSPAACDPYEPAGECNRAKPAKPEYERSECTVWRGGYSRRPAQRPEAARGGGPFHHETRTIVGSPGPRRQPRLR